MSALQSSILVAWLVFWISWLLAAAGTKKGPRATRPRAPGLIVVLGFLLLRVFRLSSSDVHSPILQAVGAILFVSGLALAVWARVNLGRNWGMPMTEKDEPELVTSGPYRFVRHPIYSGILLAVLGTALAVNVEALGVLAITAIYFVYSAQVEERLMCTSFPTTYPGYRARTKMLIPFVI